MRLSNALAPLTELRLAITSAFLPTLSHILTNPSLLFHPIQLSRLFFSIVWFKYGPCADENARKIKDRLITPHATGVVLDLGAGLGHTANYLKNGVTKYVPLEPNVYMHDKIRETAGRAGFSEDDGSLLILSCGAGDTDLINSALGGENRVDTIVSIITLCSVPNAKKAIEDLTTRVLKSGGQFLFYEHVASRRDDVRWWQALWTPLWRRFFDGCRLDRPTDLWISAGQAGAWDLGQSKTWGKDGEDEENLWWHQAGRFVKKQE